MFDRRGDDVWKCGDWRRRAHSQEWRFYQRPDDAEDGVVVGLSATAGEDDLLRARADESCDLVAGSLDGSASTLPCGVYGRGVAEIGGEVGQHGVEDFWFDGGRGVVIEIDAAHGSTLRILPEAPGQGRNDVIRL